MESTNKNSKQTNRPLAQHTEVHQCIFLNCENILFEITQSKKNTFGRRVFSILLLKIKKGSDNESAFKDKSVASMYFILYLPVSGSRLQAHQFPVNRSVNSRLSQYHGHDNKGDTI